ncbi:MAG: hypothetical protein ACPW60_00620 [Methylohalobius sp. ZOD2]
MSQSIQGTIINASYPRSGHRLLRNMLMHYFHESMVFYEPYADKIVSKRAPSGRPNLPNYIKTHDFGLKGRNELADKFPDNRRYLIQIRHPLEAIASYYEFSVRHSHIKIDIKQSWLIFLYDKLEYWKKFVDIWILERKNDSLVVKYNELVRDKETTLKSAICFLSGSDIIDRKKLSDSVNTIGFYQYAGDKKSKKIRERKIHDFKYYDRNLFFDLESSLSDSYLSRIGIDRIID